MSSINNRQTDDEKINKINQAQNDAGQALSRKRFKNFLITKKSS